MPTVLVKQGKSASVATVGQGGAVIGRNPDCDIRVSSAGVSRKHCIIEPCEAGFRVRDLGSTNGIRVNGAIVESCELKDGDRIDLGSETLLFWNVGMEAAAAQAETVPPEAARARTMVATGGAASPAAPGGFKLALLEGNMLGRTFDLPEGPVTVGRSPTCTIAIPDEKASKEHCKLVWDGDGFRAVDMGSTNGTRVNGVKVQSSRLNPGDLISVGTTGFVLLGAPEEKGPPAPVETPGGSRSWIAVACVAAAAVALALWAGSYAARDRSRPSDRIVAEAVTVGAAPHRIICRDMILDVDARGCFDVYVGEEKLLEAAALTGDGVSQKQAVLERSIYDERFGRLTLTGRMGQGSPPYSFTEVVSSGLESVEVAYQIEGASPFFEFRVPSAALRTEGEAGLVELKPVAGAQHLDEIGVLVSGRYLFLELPGKLPCDFRKDGQKLHGKVALGKSAVQRATIVLKSFPAAVIDEMAAAEARHVKQAESGKLGAAVAGLEKIAGQRNYRTAVLRRVRGRLESLWTAANRQIDSALAHSAETLRYGGPGGLQREAQGLRELAGEFAGTEKAREILKQARLMEDRAAQAGREAGGSDAAFLLNRGRAHLKAGRKELGRLFLEHVVRVAPGTSASGEAEKDLAALR